MKDSPKMKEVIERLAAKHEVDLTKIEANFRLNLPGFDRLIVENTGRSRIVVAHYFEVNGDLVPEPDVVFFTGVEGRWLPINITQSLGGFSEYVHVGEDLQPVLVNEPGQADLASFTEQWAQNIQDQGWLDQATKHVYSWEVNQKDEPAEAAQMLLIAERSSWPEPTVEAPAENELAEWVTESLCEATDGCTVEPDGSCEHGHPSWLLYFGYI